MAITPLIQEYIVDFASNNNFFFVNGVQGDGDKVRYAQISLTNNGQPYTIDENINIVIRGTTSNGDKYIDGTAIMIDSSTIKFEIKNSMLLSPGKGKYEVCFIYEEKDKQGTVIKQQILTSFPFYVVVTGSGFDAEGITKTNEFINLSQKLTEVSQALNNCNTATKDANRAATSANNAATHANNAKVDANNAIKNIENKISETNEKLALVDAATKNANDAATKISDITDAVLSGAGINDSQESYATTWSSRKISEAINTQFNLCTSFIIDGSVETSINIPNILVANYDDDVIVASEGIIEQENNRGNISLDLEGLSVEDDGNGNVSITNE